LNIFGHNLLHLHWRGVIRLCQDDENVTRTKKVPSTGYTLSGSLTNVLLSS